MQGLGRDLDVTKDHDLADGRDRHPVDLLPLERDDQMRAPAPDVRAGLVQVEHRLVVVPRDDARQCRRGRWGRGWFGVHDGFRLGRRLMDQVQRFLGQTDRGQRAAEAAVP